MRIELILHIPYTYKCTCDTKKSTNEAMSEMGEQKYLVHMYMNSYNVKLL